MSSNTTFLITGASRGLGKGLVEVFLSRPNNTVIASVRDPQSTTAKALSLLPVGQSSKLIIVKIDSKSYSDPAAAVETLQKLYKISYIDVAISNAGISGSSAPVEVVPLSSVEEHIAVNSIGPLVFFQAVFPLLKRSSNPKFGIMGSAMGSIGGMEERAQFPAYAYGASKAMAHYTARKIHYTHKNIISFALDPGFVQTDMGNIAARDIGLEKAFIEVDECIRGLVSIIDEATRESASGHFLTWDGGEFAW